MTGATLSVRLVGGLLASLVWIGQATAQTPDSIQVNTGFALVIVAVLATLGVITRGLSPNPVALLGFGLSVLFVTLWITGFASPLLMFLAFGANALGLVVVGGVATLRGGG